MTKSRLLNKEKGSSGQSESLFSCGEVISTSPHPDQKDRKILDKHLSIFCSFFTQQSKSMYDLQQHVDANEADLVL